MVSISITSLRMFCTNSCVRFKRRYILLLFRIYLMFFLRMFLRLSIIFYVFLVLLVCGCFCSRSSFDSVTSFAFFRF